MISDYNVGDLIILLTKNIHTNRFTKKIDYRSLGLFVITEKIKIETFRLYFILIY
jgi:hypothetical protein